ncbi:MAG: GNAT family N-acetyltransferase [Pseudomonadota bacterium]
MTASGAWTWQGFSELTTRDLYEILSLRAAIFIMEQDCVYLDPDGMDPDAVHCSYREEGRLLAYQRCLGPGIAFAESSIGRIVVSKNARGRDLGRELVRRGVEYNLKTWPQYAIRIGAQAYLSSFYESMGFVSEQDHYMEDGIEHVHMRLEG